MMLSNLAYCCFCDNLHGKFLASYQVSGYNCRKKMFVCGKHLPKAVKKVKENYSMVMVE